MIKTGPTGKVSRGHVLDCARAPLEEALRLYDPQLYTAWNPKKCGGWGCWEIRRKPDEKTVRYTDVFVFEGNTIVYPKYHELGLVHHVLDLAYLNYRAIEKLKKMDMWEQKDSGFKGQYLTRNLEYNEAKFDERVDDKAAVELAYNLKQMKSQIQWFKDYVASGGNPYAIAEHWKL